MTQEELFSNIRELLRNCNGREFLDKALDVVKDAINKRFSFDYDKFFEWFNARGVVEKNTPLSFLTKCGIEDINNGLFDKEYSIGTICLAELFNSLRDNEIEVVPRDTAVIDSVLKYIYVRKLMPLEQIIDWNRQAVLYLANKGKSTKDFIFLFKNTKAMRALNIPLKDIQEQADKLSNEWEALINTKSKTIVTAMTNDDFYRFTESETEE